MFRLMGGYRCFGGDGWPGGFEGQWGVLLLGVIEVVQVAVKKGFINGSPQCT